MASDSEQGSPLPPPYSPEIETPAPLVLKHTIADDIRDTALAPITESPKKRRKQVLRSSIVEHGTDVSRYLDIARDLIRPCCWDTTHVISHTYAMPEVEKRDGHIELLVRVCVSICGTSITCQIARLWSSCFIT